MEAMTLIQRWIKYYQRKDEDTSDNDNINKGWFLKADSWVTLYCQCVGRVPFISLHIRSM